MDDETNRLRAEFLDAFDKPKPAEPAAHSLVSIITDIRAEAKRVYDLTLARCDEMEHLIDQSDHEARAAADNLLGLMKRIK